MAFPAETQVLTTKGWKEIKDVAGHDRVLVRNFIGDAQFIQPFALRRRDYEGKMVFGGSSSHKFMVTPEHEIVYRDKQDRMQKTLAKSVPAKRENRLKHRSRYAPDTYFKNPVIKSKDFTYQVDTLDWYKLVGYVLRKGNISRDRKRLILTVDVNNPKKDLDLICPVLDNLGLKWSYSAPRLILVSSKTTIAYKLAYTLGSRTRKKMFLPDKMIYNSTIEQGRALIDMFVRASRKDGSGVENTVQFSTSNVKMIESLEILGLLCGFTISKLLVRPAGYPVPAGVTKRDSYAVYIRKSVEEVSIVTKEELDYSGKVYEIDIFEDQLLIKNKALPLWMKPK